MLTRCEVPKKMSSTEVVYRLPAQYNATNEVTLRDAKQALDKYVHMLRWTEGEVILDVGCGTGNVTTQILASRLPPDYKLLVGLDLSPYNVKFAADNYSDQRTIFLQADIAEPSVHTLKGCFEKQNVSTGFDKVFSLHCLDWIKNSSAQWSRNIYSLLKPNGQAFLMFFTKSAFLEMWIDAAFSDRWDRYTKAVGPYRSEFHDSMDIDGDLTKMMTKAGFIVDSCEHYPCYYDNNWPEENMFKLFQSADMYVHTIPEELHSDYFEDLFSVYKKYKHEYRKNGIPYMVSVIVACKPGN